MLDYSPEGSRENPVHVDDADDSFYYAPRRGTGRLRSTEPIQGAGPFEGTGPLYEVNPSDFSQWPLPSPRPISRTRRDRLDDNPTASSGGFTNWVRNHFSRE